jgi:hypothetical protein
MKKWLVLSVVGVAVATAGVLAFKWDEWFVWPEMRTGVLSLLVDPGSAQFRNEKAGDGYLCGEVNSRNSMGGFVGYARFISSKHAHALDGYPVYTWSPGTPDAQRFRERLKVEIEMWEKLKRQPTEREVNTKEFATLWARQCAAL